MKNKIYILVLSITLSGCITTLEQVNDFMGTFEEPECIAVTDNFLDYINGVCEGE